jgi:DNA-binding NarL/FixJ family response regulator
MLKTLNQRFSFILPALFFTIVLISSALDIADDIAHGSHLSHIIQECIVALLALFLLLVLYRSVLKEKKENRKLVQEMAEISSKSAQASEALQQAKKAFGEEILKQFSLWEFTESEAEVALFTLKGFNSKEIAQLRNVSEKTVRNQLTSIYKKSSINGKHAFIAWFMDGLL